MAIVSISKIQHRYGVLEDLPQLSAAELGWTTDQRRLFIGNGPLSEGAPEIGNTEILTEYSDILNVSDFYDYRGESVGYTHVTGSSLANPVQRTLQRKLDETVSVKDFGAVGDGVTDDTGAINQALDELYTRRTIPNVRRVLFFPAGTYHITDSIVIPTYAKLTGEGKTSSIVSGAAVYLGDSHRQIGAQIGNSVDSIAAELPGYVEISGMSFSNPNDDESVLTINSACNSKFDRVGFFGYVDEDSDPKNAVENGASCVTLLSTASRDTCDITFTDCDFKQNIFGIVADDDMDNILINSGVFENLYKGIKLGEDTDVNAGPGPRNIKITNTQFDRISREGLHVYDISDVISAFNFYNDVGNASTATPQYNVIIFETAGNSSLLDAFNRTDIEDETIARINDNSTANYIVKSGKTVKHGTSEVDAGKKITLSSPAASASISEMIYDATVEKSIMIYYTATQDTAVRNGTLRITADSNGTTVSDEYSDNGNSIDLEFSVSVSGGNTTVEYTVTGNDVTLSFRAEKVI